MFLLLLDLTTFTLYPFYYPSLTGLGFVPSLSPCRGRPTGTGRLEGSGERVFRTSLRGLLRRHLAVEPLRILRDEVETLTRREGGLSDLFQPSQGLAGLPRRRLREDFVSEDVVGSVHLRGVISPHFCDLSVWNPSNPPVGVGGPYFPGLLFERPLRSTGEAFARSRPGGFSTSRSPPTEEKTGDDPGDGYYGTGGKSSLKERARTGARGTP